MKIETTFNTFYSSVIAKRLDFTHAWAVALLLTYAGPVFADNCSSLSDCYSTIEAGVKAMLGVAFILFASTLKSVLNNLVDLLMSKAYAGEAVTVKTGATSRSVQPGKVSENLLQFLGTWENGVMNGKNFAHQKVTNGFILEVYKDSRGLPTVGCGHLVVAADNLNVGNKITEARAKELLERDLTSAANAVNANVKVPMHQHEYDALVSLTFNTGAHGASKLFDVVNAGDYGVIPATIEKYRAGHGNKARRASEAELFKSGDYNANH